MIDIREIDPTVKANLVLPTVFGMQETMQCFAISDNKIYVSQGFGLDVFTGARNSQESTVISLIEDNLFKGWQGLNLGGHGTLFGLKADTDELIANFNQVVDGKIVSSDVVLFKWSQGPFNRDNSIFKKVGTKFTKGYVIPYYDNTHNQILLRKKSGDYITYELRDFDDFVSGTDRIIASAGPFSVSYPLDQGAASYGTLLYRVTGRGSGDSNDITTIKVIDMATNKELYSYSPPFLAGKPGARIEPEGIFVTDEAVFIGTTEGVRPNLRHVIREWNKYEVIRPEDIEAIKIAVVEELRPLLDSNTTNVAQSVWDTDDIISAGTRASETNKYWKAKSFLTELLNDTTQLKKLYAEQAKQIAALKALINQK